MIELLSPAGNMAKLEIALAYGADAVYFAGKNFGLRAFAGNFSDEEIKIAVEKCHNLGKKAYLTLNILARDSDFAEVDSYLEKLCQLKVDGVIISDLGLIVYVLKNFPSLNVHVSTQASVTNSITAKFLIEQGVKRIVFARELSLKEIKEISQNLPKGFEIECFVHGAMCISYSGRCLLSNYMCGRDSNRGECVQSCRWKYTIKEYSRDSNDNEFEIEEDDRGTYILNSKDLCMIDYIGEMIDAGINSFKIEGRMKSEYYVATVTNAYRRAIDYVLGKTENKFDFATELEKTSHRRFTTGNYFKGEENVCLESSMPVQNYDFIAIVKEDFKDGYVLVEMRNRFKIGDVLEVLSSDENFNKKIVVSEIINKNNEIVDDVKSVQEEVFIKTDLILHKYDILRRKV